MAFGDITRINTNIASMQSLHEFNKTNADLEMHRLRLASGKRINSASDDPAGYAIATRLESKVRGQAQALANIGDAKSVLTSVENSYDSIKDILLTMKDKATQAANGTLSTEERTSLNNALDSLSGEIDSLLGDAEFNGISVFTNTAFNFLVGAGTTDTYSVTVGTRSATALGVSAASLDVASAASAILTMDQIDSAINSVTSFMAEIGSNQLSLSFREASLSQSIINHDAARSRVEDADFAKEQIEVIKLQIMQQTGLAAIQGSLTAPQAVLSLL